MFLWRYIKIAIKAVIFDLDGTLLDTLQDLADSMNAALARFNLPIHPVDSYRYFVGDSVKWMVKRTLSEADDTEEMEEKCLNALTEEYARRWHLNTKPYPHIESLLTELEKRNIPKAILSNKPHNFTTIIVEKMLPKWHFEAVQGVNESVTKKPDPAGALDIAKKLNMPAEKILYLGDTNTDMQTAIAAGMYPVGALWGFRDADELRESGAKVLVEKPLDVLKIIDPPKAKKKKTNKF